MVLCSATGISGSSQISINGTGSVVRESQPVFHFLIDCSLGEWPGPLPAQVQLSITFLGEGGLTIPFRGSPGADILTVQRQWTEIDIVDRSLLVVGQGFDNTRYFCSMTDDQRVTIQTAQRINTTHVNCSTTPTNFRVITSGGPPRAPITVTLLRLANGQRDEVSYAGETGADTVHVTTCDDGARNGDETHVDCGGSCQPCGINQGCRRDSDCNATANLECRSSRCAIAAFASCKAAYQAGQRSSGMYNLLMGGSIFETYCDQTTAGGGWTLVLKVTNMDGSIDFRLNGNGWRATQYGSARAAGAAQCTAPLYRCSSQCGGCQSRDFVSLAYGRLTANDIMLRESLGSTNRLLWSRDSQNCLRGTNLRSILTQDWRDGGVRCCTGLSFGSGTRRQSSYTNLVLRGDESGDTEPGTIGLRNRCNGDSEMMMLGNYQPGGDRSGHRETHSQSNYWSNFRGMWVFVRE